MKLFSLVVAIVLLVVIYFLEEKTRYGAGLAAALPIKVAAVMFMVWFSSSNLLEVSKVASGMIMGVFGTVAFLGTCAILLRLGVNFYATLGSGMIVWVLVALAPKWIPRLFWPSLS